MGFCARAGFCGVEGRFFTENQDSGDFILMFRIDCKKYTQVGISGHRSLSSLLRVGEVPVPVLLSILKSSKCGKSNVHCTKPDCIHEGG